jgi:hypothetical protein
LSQGFQKANSVLFKKDKHKRQNTLKKNGGNMAKKLGLWIDHEKAFLIEITKTSEKRRELTSGIETPTKPKGLSHTASQYGRFDRNTEGKAAHRRENQLKNWYDEIIKTIKDTQDLLILGPGKAKTELAKAIKSKKSITPKIREIKNADAMSQNQLAAVVREYFSEEKQKTTPHYRRPPGS